jgi:hypothetical protein
MLRNAVAAVGTCTERLLGRIDDAIAVSAARRKVEPVKTLVDVGPGIPGLVMLARTLTGPMFWARYRVVASV